MRTLFLLRHALAAQSQGTDDKHRPLTVQGAADARALGQLMKVKNYRPEFVICSPARRTQQTLRRLNESLDEVQTVSPNGAYYTTMGQLYELIKQANSNVQSLLLISHNPSIHALAKFLSGIGISDSASLLKSGYKECTLTVLECPIDQWSDLMPNENDIADLLIAGRDFTGEPPA